MGGNSSGKEGKWLWRWGRKWRKWQGIRKGRRRKGEKVGDMLEASCHTGGNTNKKEYFKPKKNLQYPYSLSQKKLIKFSFFLPFRWTCPLNLDFSLGGRHYPVLPYHPSDHGSPDNRGPTAYCLSLPWKWNIRHIQFFGTKIYFDGIGIYVK